MATPRSRFSRASRSSLTASSVGTPSSLASMSLAAPLSSLSPLSPLSAPSPTTRHSTASRDATPPQAAGDAAPGRPHDAPGTRASVIVLAGGQSFHGYLARGTVLHVQRGRVTLTLAPRWMAASVWQTTVSLAAGEVCVIPTTGWQALTSDTGAELAVRDGTARASLWQRLRARLGV
ncbi:MULTISPECIES: hypothetical protein [Pandoraea]|uniref:hypothetical protein n=1 Tax=Pandoraea TaxID=93217 RepID=UPI0003D23CEB|nr:MULTISPECIES: hypothetical protein [Pandoraea]AHB78395.1 hypothetical protein X636_05580 [Pandoraea pnomenusa]MBN9093963.1 hypothetical protein [Pandoraea pnomenusa]QDH61166.1 hypothetical protein FKQ53_19125 [Pandoraea pnomenusa]